jgi:6,7-dimethyl-8-ribityllumazine synthase
MQTNTWPDSETQNHNGMASQGNAQLVKLDTGAQDYSGACVVLIRTEWNADIVDELGAGAVRMLSTYGVADIRTVVVPGAVEIPFSIRNYWEMHKYKDVRPGAFIALGTVIRGDTPHFDYVCQSVTQGITQLNLMLPVPSVFGILTVDDLQQARERIGGKHGHKGEEAAITALKMISLIKKIKAER